MEGWNDGMVSGQEGTMDAARRMKDENEGDWVGDTFTPRTGCYSATLPSPLVRNGDPGCYIGCYKVLHRVLHSSKFESDAQIAESRMDSDIPVEIANNLIVPRLFLRASRTLEA
jgi:hypothetical protein